MTHLNRANKRVSLLNLITLKKERLTYAISSVETYEFFLYFPLVLKTNQGSASFGGVLGNRTVKNETGLTTPERQVRDLQKFGN